MRNEFRYWYPMNLRCSGKDLIKNHLTMCLFNHSVIYLYIFKKMHETFIYKKRPFGKISLNYGLVVSFVMDMC